MKPRIRIKTRSIFPIRPRGSHAAGRVLESIRNITQELEDLQAEIYGRMGGPAELLQGFSMRERDTAERSLSDFRLALDQLRYVLWLSSEPSTGKTDSPANVPESGRLTEVRVTPAPRRDSASLPSDSPTSASFFDRLDVVIEAYMNNNIPAHSSARKRPKQ
jgi:hypothetical protein